MYLLQIYFHLNIFVAFSLFLHRVLFLIVYITTLQKVTGTKHTLVILTQKVKVFLHGRVFALEVSFFLFLVKLYAH